MEFDLPELPFVPGSIVSEVEDEREGQYQTLQDKYVAPASTTFNSEIERCEGLQALITDDDDGMLLTDDVLGEHFFDFRGLGDSGPGGNALFLVAFLRDDIVA